MWGVRRSLPCYYCFWPCKFFHGFLAKAEPEAVLELINRLRKEADILEKSLIEIAVYSGGSISWQETQMMSIKEREITVSVINKYNQIKSGKFQEEF